MIRGPLHDYVADMGVIIVATIVIRALESILQISLLCWSSKSSRRTSKQLLS